MRLSMIALGVADLERSVAFYERGLGWPVRSRDGDLVTFETGPTRLCLYPAGQLTAFAGVRPSAAGASVLHAINVEAAGEVDVLAARAQAHGGTLTRAAAPLPWGGYGACVTDPDGHVWEIAFAG